MYISCGGRLDEAFPGDSWPRSQSKLSQGWCEELYTCKMSLIRKYMNKDAYSISNFKASLEMQEKL